MFFTESAPRLIQSISYLYVCVTVKPLTDVCVWVFVCLCYIGLNWVEGSGVIEGERQGAGRIVFSNI